MCRASRPSLCEASGTPGIGLEHGAFATYKLATGFVMVPLTITVGVIVGALVDGGRGAVIALVAVPLLGFIAMEWRDRWREFREDARLFFNVLLRRDHQERLARDRAKLVAEFDELVDASQAQLNREFRSTV